MMNIQQHLEVQASAQQWADDFMNNYNISATEMTDALTKVLLNLKDKVMVEYLTEIAAQQMQSWNNIQQENLFEETPQEEEVDYGKEQNNNRD